MALVIILTRYCTSCVTCKRQISVTFPVGGKKDTSSFISIKQLLICELTFCLLKVLYKNYSLFLFKEFQPHLQYINSADTKEPFVFSCGENEFLDFSMATNSDLSSSEISVVLVHIKHVVLFKKLITTLV